MKKIKVELVNKENFAEFGELLEIDPKNAEGESGHYEWYEKLSSVKNAEEVSVNFLKAIQRPYKFKKFESHARTSETHLPLDGPVIVHCAPAGKLEPDKVRCFLVPQGKGICWAEGVWHLAPFPVGRDTMLAVIFRHGTGKDDVVFAELDEEFGMEL